MGLFHPTATSGIHTPGVSSRCSAVSTSSVVRALMSVGALYLPRAEALGAGNGVLRLQGLLPSSDPLRDPGGLDLDQLDPLLRFHPPRASLRTPWPCLHSASAHGLFHPGLTVPRLDGLQRLFSARPVDLSLDRLPVRGFRPADPPAEANDPARPDVPNGPLRPPNSRVYLQCPCQPRERTQLAETA